MSAGGNSGPNGDGAGDRPAPDRKEKILGIIEKTRSKPGKFKDPQITMSHGAGGKATQSLIEGLLVPAFSNEPLAKLGDAGAVEANGTPLAMTMDSFVVSPLQFPGGSIGELAVNGTVNDLAVSGARPLTLTLAMVLEEGLDTEVLRQEVDAIARAAREAEVEIVGGDTKVVERGLADSMYLATAGVGLRDPRAELSTDALRPGDRVLVSGTMGDHGTAIMLSRNDFDLVAEEVKSDTRSLWPLVDALLEEVGPSLRCMRDATRGGVASVLNELARASQVAMVVREAAGPVHPAVAGASDILGLDPWYVANEGKLVAFVAPEAADKTLEVMRSLPGSEQAAEIGEVQAGHAGMVKMETAFGGGRTLDLLVGDPLPRIC
ncbi:MAG: hydrogenase expression/formation protein HypE [Actinomycetota bacterium]|nr:hydrogenase expression/formation protein HypE [Actinomycetota bacterium]